MSQFQDIIDFLETYPPFSDIPSSIIEHISSRIKITYIKAGDDLNINQNPSLRVIRNGSVEVRSRDGQLLDRLSSGGCFGYSPLLTGDNSSRRFTALEDGLVYLISPNDFSHLRHNHPEFDHFFARETRRRAELQNKPISKDVELDLDVEKIMNRNLLTVPQDSSIRQTAKAMTEARVSSALVVQEQKLIGIITDRDLRTRVVAENVDAAAVVTTIMTNNPVSLAPDDSVHHAYITMMSLSIHHMPITEDGIAVGILTLSDLLRARNSEPLFFIKAIQRADSPASLAALAQKFPGLIEKLILAEVSSEEIGKIITLMVDAVTIRLLKLGQDQIGAAPCNFCWLAFGSQGRKEQTLNSDQDNGFLLDNKASNKDIDYFLKLGEFVCDGLNDCGVPHCPGNIMAKNPAWVLRLNQWQDAFANWIDTPQPEAVLNISIFFDMRMVDGDNNLFSALRGSIQTKAQGKDVFLFCLLKAALTNSPPLGFFKTFVLERDGNHNAFLDLKHRGTAPIVDLARLYSLSNGITLSNTQERLRYLENRKALHIETATSLLDAFRFIAELKLKNQQKQLLSGNPASNNLDPKQISPLLRHQLKDAFAVVQECQQSAKLRFGRGAL